MHGPIEDLYFDWLCAKVRTDDTRSYHELFRILHSYPFQDPTGLDENRCEDAKERRVYFLQETGLNTGSDWLQEDASVLEVLIAFSETAAFQIEMSARDWFWQFITNLKLEDYRRVSVSDRPRVYEILDRFVLRTYEPNGDGGLFPLRRPHHDQRRVEIWYQFCEYVEDNGLLYGLI